MNDILDAMIGLSIGVGVALAILLASGDRDANRLNDDSDSVVYYDLVPGKDYSFTWG